MKRLYVYVTPGLVKELTREAKEEGRSLSEYARRLLEGKDRRPVQDVQDAQDAS
jgi:predicted CopG family antitoxin